jgi:hypothetical protein
MEKRPDGEQPGMTISTGGASILNDFAAGPARAGVKSRYERIRCFSVDDSKLLGRG